MRFLHVLPLLAVLAISLGGPAQDRYELGKKAMAAGDLPGAMEHFHFACDNAPTQYEFFNMRAILYLAMGRAINAIRDFSTVLQLKPDYVKARQQRADLLLKQGRFEEAKADYAQLAKTPENEESLRKLERGAQLTLHAKSLYDSNNCEQAVPVLSEAIEIASNDGDLRMWRGLCFEKLGQIGEAIGDITRAARLKNDNIQAYFILSQLQYKLGESGEALKQIRECLKLDPEYKVCMDFYTKLKKLQKLLETIAKQMEAKQYAQAIASIEKAKKIETTAFFYVNQMLSQECEAFAALGKIDDGIKSCNNAIAYNQGNIDAYIWKAKCRELGEDFEGALNDLKQALQHDNENQKAKENIQRVEKLLKQAKKRDYYKILGVPRNADKKAILKAYRDLALIWHPDKFEGEEEKMKAQAKFMDIAAAKEVLSDPDKRAIFDQGDDPLDAESERDRQQQQHNPWGNMHGFNQGGGGGGQQFHFRWG